MSLFEHPLRQLTDAWMKLAKGGEHFLDGLVPGHLLFSFRDRCIDVVTRQLFDAQPPSLQTKEPLKQSPLFPHHVQEGVHRSVRDVVLEVSVGDGRRKPPQRDGFVVPIPHSVGVDLPQDGGLSTEHSVELPIGRGAHFRRVGKDIAHQAVASQHLLLAVYFEVELQAVGEDRIEGDQALDAVGVLEVDHLFRGLFQSEGLPAPLVLEIVAVVRLGALGAGREQPVRFFVAQTLPPQAEEQATVIQVGDELFDSVAVAQRLAGLGVGAEPQMPIAFHDVDLLQQRLVLPQEFEQGRRRHLRMQLRSAPFEGHRKLLQLLELCFHGDSGGLGRGLR